MTNEIPLQEFPVDSNTTVTPEKKRRGRPKGSIGRRSRLAQDLAARILDPLEFLLRQASNPKNCLEYRIDCAKACLPYVHPKLSTTFIAKKSESTVTVTARATIQKAMEDPSVAKALEKLSLACSEAERTAGNPARSPHVIDLPALPAASPDEDA